MEKPEPRVRAEGIGVRGQRGWAFRGLDLEAPHGELTVVSGPAGSGRTSLLLALAGRMKLTEGTATVAGAELPDHFGQVQRLTALGLMEAANPLEPELTVGEHLREAMSLRGLFRNRAKVEAVLEKAGLEIDPGTVGWRLSPEDAQLLGLAMALTGSPEVIFLDDVAGRLDSDRQHSLWARIARLTEDHELTIIAACHDPSAAGEFAARIVEMPVAA